VSDSSSNAALVESDVKPTRQPARKLRKGLRKEALQLPDASNGAIASREQLFVDAGVTRQQQAEIMREALDVARSKLTATKVTRLVVRDGRDLERVEEFVDIDHATQQKAVTQVFDLLGANASTKPQASAPPGPTKIEIHFAPLPDSAPPARVIVDGKTL
jgi:hypothetical protein